MKIRLLDNGFVRLIMRVSLLQTFMIVGFVGISYANDVMAQKILDEKVSIEFDQTSIRVAFSRIERQTGAKFLYQSQLILGKKVTALATNEPLGKVLDQILLPLGIYYEADGNHIVLSEMKSIQDLPLQSEADEVDDMLTVVQGKLTDENNQPLPGVNVLVKGTTTGTTSDALGSYSIDVAEEDAVLIFSFIGYETQEISVSNRTEINIQMQPDIQSLGEVVVTALGIKREKKSLTYSSQNVDLETFDEVRPAQNLVNGLQGKVAGLSIVRTGNGVSGSSRVNLRGNRSIDGSSQPLYVVDGVPIGGDISDISPDDVATINVLKGGNAAALYGSRANNGAIIITTKSGGSDRLSIDFNATASVETGKLLFDFQDEYGQGVGGSYYSPEDGTPLSGSLESWGQRLNGTLVPHWSPDPNKSGVMLPYSSNPNRHNDFMQTGSTAVYTLSARAGSEKSQLYFGFTNDSRKGIMPGNELNRNNVSLKINQKFFKNKLVLDAKINYIRTDLDNELATGGNFENPWRHVYRIPNNIRVQDLKEFEYSADDGSVLQNYWLPGSNGGSNPYWVARRNLTEQFTNRILSYGSLAYNFTEKLSLMARSAFETSSSYQETRFYNDTYIIAQNGEYRTQNSQDYDWNTDFLLSYNDQISKDWKYSINAGGNIRKVSGHSVSTVNNGLSVPNIFALSNALQPAFSEGLSRKEVQSLYVFGQTSFKDIVFLDLTYRNDWSSTLPEANRSFGYYSAGLSAVISDMFEFGKSFNYLKFRGSIAEVGNDTGPFKLDRAGELRPGGLIYLSPVLPNENLKAEKTISSEVGVDARFFESRLALDISLYKTNTTDQLFAQDVPLGSGVRSRFLNGADIENRGIEMILTAHPVTTDNFNWTLTFNFAKNESEVIKLAEGLDRLSIGNGSFGIRNMQLTVGSKWGDYYSRGFERDQQGRIIVAENGLPETTAGKSVKVSNFNPDWLGGIRNTLQYKDFQLTFLIDIRQGGSVISASLASLASGGFLESTVAGRDGSLVVGRNIFGTEGAVKADGSPNDIQVTSEDLWKSLGKSEQPVGEAFVEDASNIRMREFALAYTLPTRLLNSIGLKNGKISLVGSNLFFFSRKASFDPEITTGIQSNEEGYEFFAPPFTRSIGLNLKFGF